MAKRKRSTTRRSAQTKAVDPKNLFSEIVNFYFDQIEQSAPIMKQATEDWFSLAGKLLDKSIEVQEKIFGPILRQSLDPAPAASQGKLLVQKVIDVQKDITLSTIDSVTKNVKSFRQSSRSGK